MKIGREVIKFLQFRARMVLAVVFVSLLTGPMLLIGTAGEAMAAAGACTAPATDNGKDTITVNVPSAGTYRIWSHMLVPSATADTYLLQVDSSNCYTMGGGSGITPNTWTWVDYADGIATVPVDLPNLASGSHTLTLYGTASGVTLDDILLVSVLSCVPTGNGSNCGGDTSVTATVSASSSASPGADTTTNGGSSSSNGSSNGSKSIVGASSKGGTNWPLIIGAGVAIVALVGGGIWFIRHRSSSGSSLQV